MLHVQFSFTVVCLSHFMQCKHSVVCCTAWHSNVNSQFTLTPLLCPGGGCGWYICRLHWFILFSSGAACWCVNCLRVERWRDAPYVRSLRHRNAQFLNERVLALKWPYNSFHKSVAAEETNNTSLTCGICRSPTYPGRRDSNDNWHFATSECL